MQFYRKIHFSSYENVKKSKFQSNWKMLECFFILFSIKAIPVQGIIVDDKKIMYMIKRPQKVSVMWWSCIKSVCVRHSLSKRFISSSTLLLKRKQQKKPQTQTVRTVLMPFNVLYLAERCKKGCGMVIIDFLGYSVDYAQQKRFKWKYLLFINDTKGITDIWGKTK